ncbi:MAG: DUF364 domain-containing protein [Pseudomonadota bacterium]
MRLRKRLIDILEPACVGRVVEDVRIGLGYTAVRLDNGRAGVAYTLGRDRMSGCTAFGGNRPISGKQAVEVLRYLDFDGLVEASVGLATANALINRVPRRGMTGDVLKAVEIFPTDSVAMVGFFAPLAAQLQDRVAVLEIFEKQTGLSSNLRCASEAVSALPGFNVAFITSTAIIDGSIDELLEAARDCREVVLLGPSTPLIKEAFDGTPTTRLSGMIVDDPDGLLQLVSEGGGTRLFRPFVTKWNISLRDETIDTRNTGPSRPA